MKDNNNFEAICEAGWAGNLNIQDPSSFSVDKKKKSLEEMIIESEQNNKNINVNQ